jgi:spermidine synthase
MLGVTVGCVVAGVAIGLFALARPANELPADATGERVLFKKDTQYHRLLVTEDRQERHLRFDRSHQSAMYLADPFETSFEYPQYLHLVLAAKPDAKKVLIVGLGGGSLVKRMWRDYPEMTIDVAEIDPVVVDVASRYFAVPDDSRIRTFAEDGRRFLNGTDERYDVIVMDAYYADSLPSHLTTAEFFKEAKAHLSPDGVLAYNVIGSVEGDRSRLFRSMYRTAASGWENLWVFPIGIGGDGAARANRNIIVLATDRPLAQNELLDAIADRAGGQVTVNGFEGFARDLYTGPVSTDDVPLLTDQHAPTDALIRVN